MIRFNVPCAILVLSSLVACEYRHEKIPGTANSRPIEKKTSSQISFAHVEARVLEPKCASCHNPNTDFDICSYEVAVASKELISQRINSAGSDQMPPPGAPALTLEEKSLLMEWINAGAPK